MKKLKFTIHPLFILLMFVFIYQGLFELLLAYLITIILHEFAHYLVANRLGYHLNRFTLMPHGISLSGKNVLFSYKDEILIALAGPLCNFILAILCVALWWIFPVTYVYTEVFVIANVITGAINLLPIFPMDGGRIALAFLGQKITRKRAYGILKIVGLVVSFLLLVSFVITTFFVVKFNLLVMSIFCFLTVIWEDKTNIYQKISFLDSKISGLKNGLVVREVAVHEDTTLYKLVSQVRADSITNFRVLKSDLTVSGYISENQLEKLVQIYPASATLKTILS